MSSKNRKRYSRDFKEEDVRLITDKGYSVAEASRNLCIDYSVLRRWKKELILPLTAHPPARANCGPPIRKLAAKSVNWSASQKSVTS